MARHPFLILGLAVAVGVLALNASAAQPDRVEAGRRVAVRACGGCHAVQPGAASPMPEAPAFAELARRFPVGELADPRTSDARLADLPHMQAFHMDPDERAELVAWLESLKPPPRS